MVTMSVVQTKTKGETNLPASVPELASPCTVMWHVVPHESFHRAGKLRKVVHSLCNRQAFATHADG